MSARLPKLALLALAIAAAGGCAKINPAAAPATVRRDEPPHGGTPVVLGTDDYHLELVVDRASGRIQIYVLDGEMEDFVRSSSAAIEIAATLPGGARTLRLSAVANPVTGETVGDTSLFEGQAEWLRATPAFDGVVQAVMIRGTPYTGVAFNFPRGNGAGP